MWTPPRTEEDGVAEQHGELCTPRCLELAVGPQVLVGPRSVACPWCGAEPGRCCQTVAHDRLTLHHFGPFHPSRVEAAA